MLKNLVSSFLQFVFLFLYINILYDSDEISLCNCWGLFCNFRVLLTDLVIIFFYIKIQFLPYYNAKFRDLSLCSSCQVQFLEIYQNYLTWWYNLSQVYSEIYFSINRNSTHNQTQLVIGIFFKTKFKVIISKICAYGWGMFCFWFNLFFFFPCVLNNMWLMAFWSMGTWRLFL